MAHKTDDVACRLNRMRFLARTAIGIEQSCDRCCADIVKLTQQAVRHSAAEEGTQGPLQLKNPLHSLDTGTD